MGFLEKNNNHISCGRITFEDGRVVTITDYSEYNNYVLLRTQDGGRIFFGYLYNKETKKLYQQYYDGKVKEMSGASVVIEKMHYEE